MPQKISDSVSVIIPTFNSAAYIAEAIQSVLQQTVKPYEVIVVDDGSTDDTQNALRQYAGKIKTIRTENHGPAHARNTGMKMATGEYIAFLDSDDIWLPEKTAMELDAFRVDPETVLVYSRFYNINEQSNETVLWPHQVFSGFVFDKLLVHRFIGLPTVMLKREILNDVGFFNEELFTAEDTNYFLRIAKKYKIIGIEQPLMKRRIHGSNISARLDVKIGTLDNLDNIVQLYPECAPQKYPRMYQAYAVRGMEMVLDSFNKSEYDKSRNACRELIRRGIKTRQIMLFALLTMLPGFMLNVIRAMRRYIKG